MPLLYTDIINFNTQDQLFERGIKASGEYVPFNSPGQPYSEAYTEYKRSVGDPYDRVTLRDSGAFYNDFIVTRVSNGWEVDSTNEKRDKLVQNYDEDIFGLTADNTEELSIEYVLPSLIESYKMKINESIKNL